MSGVRICSCIVNRSCTYYRIVCYTCRICRICHSRLSDSAKCLIRSNGCCCSRLQMVNNYISGIISSVIVCYSLISGCKCSVCIARYTYQCIVRDIMVGCRIWKPQLTCSVQRCIRCKRCCCTFNIVMYCNISCILSSVLIYYRCCSCCRICSCVVCRCHYKFIVRYSLRCSCICKSRLSDTT